MEGFNKLFLVEAREITQSLENALISLERNPADKELLNEVFRFMHSLKGSGAMFGYQVLSNFTHILENLYDGIRNQEINLNSDILDITFKSVDLFNKLLTNEISSETITSVNELSATLQAILGSNSPEKTLIDNATHSDETKGENTYNKVQDLTSYFIRFEPHADILENGTNPLYLIEELNCLGQAFINPDASNIPMLQMLNPEKCYISWEIILATGQNRKNINDVFVFVKDDSTIDIEEIAPGNILDNPSCIEYLNQQKVQQP